MRSLDQSYTADCLECGSTNIDVSFTDDVKRAVESHSALLNACIAALSQLTEERPEYLKSDIRQLRDAIAQAEGR